MSRFQVKQHPPCLQCKAFAANFFDANSHSGQGAVSQDLNLEILETHGYLHWKKFVSYGYFRLIRAQQQTFPSSPNGFHRIFSIFSASKVRTGADRLWAPFPGHQSWLFSMFCWFSSSQFIDYIDFVWIFIVSSSIILSGFRISTSLTWMSLACEGDAKERMLLGAIQNSARKSIGKYS